ncbi:MAG: DUF222 domain-containing protein, partial [Actinobacteria bacterium]|nr:DUF222 domain-containing protein [Actinomycetota bacterium]
MSIGPGVPTVEPLDPFGTDEFRSDLASLGESIRAGWQRWGQECLVLARLAAQVPRAPMDARGGTAWTSFLREIAVTRRCSDQAAAKEVLVAVALVSSHPRTLALVQAGQMPQYSARVLVEESLGLPTAAIAEVEAELAERACRLAPSRILDAVRKIELRHDADAAAARSAKAATARGVRLQPQPDGQASLTLSGPALPVVQFFAALTAQARAARVAGDPRGVDALRFDLATAAVLPSGSRPVP